MQAVSSIHSAMRTKAFLLGFLVILVGYASLFAWSYLNSTSALKELESHLASQSVLIERQGSITISELNNDNDQHTQPDTHNAQHPPEGHNDTGHESTATVSEQHTAQHASSASALISAPVDGFFEQDAQGQILPVIRKNDGLTPFHVYKKPYAANGNPIIAIVIDDYGLSLDQAEALLENIPANATILMSPYAQSPDKAQVIARRNGNEIWLKVPFENKNFPLDDSGAKTILSRTSLGNNTNNLKWAMSRTSGYAGIASFIDVAFSSSRPMITSLSREILSRGLGYFEMNVGASSQIKDIAVPMRAPYIRNDIVLMDPKWKGDFKQSFELLESIAQSKGYAVGIIKPYPQILKSLNDWQNMLTKKGISLAPLSAIAFASNPTLENIDISQYSLQGSAVDKSQSQSSQHLTAPSSDDHH